MAEYKIPLLAIVGPTASGKTALAAEIAKRLSGEVVSADSMQIYEGMDIATAKPTEEEMQQVPHHLIGIVGRSTPFSVADYCTAAHEKIREIHSRGKLPVLCGGTGLYISSVIDNLSFSGSGADEEIRAQLRSRADSGEALQLLNELYEIDPETAKELHVNNVGRIIRALEIYKTSGITMSEQKKLSKSIPSPYRTQIIFLDARDRQVLYDRINLRVDKMLEAGLLKEAEEFCNSDRGTTASQAIGLKELVSYFDGSVSLDAAIEKIKQETRRYAKRQLTWFNRLSGSVKIFIDDYVSPQELFDAVEKLISSDGR